MGYSLLEKGDGRIWKAGRGCVPSQRYLICSLHESSQVYNSLYKKMGDPRGFIKVMIRSYDRKYGEGAYMWHKAAKLCPDAGVSRACDDFLVKDIIISQAEVEAMPKIKNKNRLYRYIKKLEKQKYRIVDKLTKRFLKDEAKKLKQRKLLKLRRILKKLAKKKGMII